MEFFWVMIGANDVANASDIEMALAKIGKRLRELGTDELLSFEERFGEVLRLLDLPELAKIPVELPSGRVLGQSADHFLYARCACILAGEKAVAAAGVDRLTFARFVHTGLQSAENLLYLAADEYQSRTGSPMPWRRGPA